MTDLKKVLNDYLVAWNSHDVEKILSFFADDGMYEDVAMERISRGKKELMDQFGSMLVDIPDFQLELKSSFFAGDTSASEWIMSGTFAHSGITGVPATGKSFTVRLAAIIEFRKGKISRESDYWNAASFMQQVGLMPAPAK